MRKECCLLGLALAFAGAEAGLFIRTSASVERLANGNTLITESGDPVVNRGLAIEVDSLGRLVWAYVRNDIPWVHSARRLANGNTLLTATNRDCVLEVDRAGNSVWACSTGLRYPNDAHRLTGGRTLVTDRDHNRVVELDSVGAAVWQFAGLARPHNGTRLANGNTLVGDSDRNRVVEVDSSGRIVWLLPGSLRWPRSAQRLASGRTLIADTYHQQVVEADSIGNFVWAYRESLAAPYEAVRLANGNTLISNSNMALGGDVREVDSGGSIVWRYPGTVPVLVETLWVRNPTSGCSLYTHIHRPAYASAQNRVPGVVLVPGGRGYGSSHDSTGLADRIADDGFAVLHFDPDGRGRSGPFPEDYNGHLHQDGLRACFEELAGREYVDTAHCGMFSTSYGITMASGVVARYAGGPRVGFLLDFEGPADRYQTCRDSGGHVPVPVDSEGFWVEREAARFMKLVACPYLRIQTEQDHNPRIVDNRHCIALVDSATHTLHGGSGLSVWTRVNDSVMNEPNRVYTVEDPPEWIPEGQQVHGEARQLLYLHELARMEFVAVAERHAARPPTGLSLLQNPVRRGEIVRVRGAVASARAEVRDCTGRRVARMRAEGPGKSSWDGRLASGETAPAGCYWIVSAAGCEPAGTKVVLAP